MQDNIFIKSFESAVRDLTEVDVFDGVDIEETDLGLRIERREIQARTRRLNARWTIEAQQDLTTYVSSDLEQEIMDRMAQEIANEIDNEIVNRITTTTTMLE